MVVRHLPTSLGDVDEPYLTEVLEGVWALLAEGVRNSDHGFHLPALASVGEDGRPGLRTVVLRALDRNARELHFHTDARSPKLRALQGEPRVALLLYDAAEQTQLRIDAVASVHRGDALAGRAWKQSRLSSRRCYLQSAAPGTPLPAAGSSLPPALERRLPSRRESEAGRDNFAVVVCRIQAIDWFYMSDQGQRRACFTWDRQGCLAADWLAP